MSRATVQDSAFGAGVVIAATVGAAFMLRWLLPFWSTQIFWEVRSSLFWSVPLLVCVLLVAFTFNMEVYGGFAALLAFVAIAIFIGYSACYHGYAQDQVYAKSIVVSNDPMLDMNIRTPYSVAQAQAKTTLSNIAGADLLADTTRFDQQGDKFTTLASGRDMLGNYSAVAVQQFPLTGRSHGSQCLFSDNARHALSGSLTHSLGRVINEKQRGVNWSESDSYGLCADDGTPLVIVPLKKQVGWFVVTEVPAGAAVYNGHTDEVYIEHDTSKLEGATYPLSLSARQRESSDALGGWWQYVRNQIGWRPAAGEVNSANSAEFVLGGKDGKMYYVTPLSLQGNSTGIAAVSVMNADSEKYGERSMLTVYTTAPTWVSVEAVESRIKADYQDIPNWQTIAVQEVVPVGGNRWIATLGNDQNTQYRVEGTGDLSPIADGNDAATCLYQGTDAAPIRCGTLAMRGGNGVGTQYGTVDRVPVVASPQTQVPVNDMSDAELAALLRQIADEISHRSGGR